jgi:hypothetical protein
MPVNEMEKLEKLKILFAGFLEYIHAIAKRYRAS